MSKKSNTLMAFFAGAAAGTLAGLLLAPDNGKKTRQKLATQADSLGSEVATQWKSGTKQVRKLADQAVHEVERYGKKLGVN
ncbi:MAG TPA: YtxH domain-containing protein [Cytophagales bacterium]|nr:YtxH domain-containing protein [Cytophagales bacterium]HAA20754.1 YtxH domain-containing protein [Cytophagales bacterium]HAP63394.1 YtxH domain-containing protein [Cytophagales bacterium]